MKIDGVKQDFTYDSPLWSNKQTLNEDSVAIDDVQAKLASYWTLPFSEIRLGMKEGTTQPRWIIIKRTADSLYGLIADGRYRATNIGQLTWTSLLSRSFMQTHCLKVHTI